MRRIKQSLSVVLILVTALSVLSGCDIWIGKSATEQAENAENEGEEPVVRGIDAPGFERTMITAEHAKNGEIYKHGEDGYFLLAENGADTDLKAQTGGTCWANAAATAMESSARYLHGEELFIEPLDIVNAVYDEEKKEGLVPERVNKVEYGGIQWSVVETLSNGFGDRILVAGRCCDELTRDEIKDTIKKYGAVTIGMTDDHNGRWFIDGYYTQFDSENKDDHEVAIVGWDDHFPKEYFREQPSGDGAWITQDSLNASDYVYVSYDASIMDSCSFELGDGYGDVAAYEGGCENKIKTGDETVLANVFHKKGTLGAVGTYFPKRNEHVHIAIYDENSDELLHEQDAEFDLPGYYLIPLDSKIDVEDYRIEITYDDYAPVEGEEFFDGFLRYKAGIEKGQSYVKLNGEWLDLAEKQTQDALGIDFTPNNACIKGIYEGA